MEIKKMSSNRKYIELGMHLLIWGLLVSWPFLSGNAGNRTFSENVRLLSLPVFAAIIFYLNYFFLIRTLLFREKIVLFFIGNMVAYALCIFLMASTRQSAGEDNFPRQMRPSEELPNFPRRNENGPVIRRNQFRPAPGFPPATGIVVRALITFALTTGLSVAIQTTKQWFRSEDSRRELEREHLKSELANLKNQLNPHFFFNTLNNIYSLIALDQQRAQSAVHHLGKLMRYLLYESNEKHVPLSKEIAFLKHYIDLMKLRVTSNVDVHYNLPKDGMGYQIAPLLFISLIENSFKHGISLTEPSAIKMEMQINTQKELTFTIQNTIIAKNDDDRSGSGIGLENLKKRLALLYPNRHMLEIRSEEKIYTTILRLLL